MVEEEFTLLDRLIAIAHATGTAVPGRSRAATCALEEHLSNAAGDPDRVGPKISSRTVSLIFHRTTRTPRGPTIDAIAVLFRDPSLRKVLNARIPQNWDKLSKGELLKELGLPDDTQLKLEQKPKKIQPYHIVSRAHWVDAFRDKIEQKYGGVYSVYRRHARKQIEEIVEDVLWIGFINGSHLPQALLLTEDGEQLIGEVTPTGRAWSIQFISLNTDDKDGTENDTLRIERRDGRNIKVFPGIRTRRSHSGGNIAYKSILVRHRVSDIPLHDPDPDAFEKLYRPYVFDHAAGSPVQKIMMPLVQDDYRDDKDADRGVMHMRGTDLDYDLKDFDPTLRLEDATELDAS